MGRRASCLLMLFLLAASLAAMPLPAKAEHTTITVPDDYPTIQQAIDAANPGDTVYVKAGNYTGTVEVNKSISLIGEDNKAVINDWELTGQAAILVTHSNVTVSGMTVDNPTYVNMWLRKRGIHLLGVSNCTVTGNVVRHCDSGSVEGIWLYQSENNLVADNLVEDGSIGISIGASRHNLIINNTVRNATEAVYLYQSSNNVITQNRLEDSGVGFQITESDSNSFTANNLTCHSQAIVFQTALDSFSTEANGNLFMYNNFFAATHYPYIRVCLGLWDNPLDTQYTVIGTNYFDDGFKGNFYAQYGGKDLNHDGIGDLAYGLSYSGNFTDYRPLMSPWLGKSLGVEVYSPNPNITVTTSDISLNFTVNMATSMLKYSLDGAQNINLSSNATISGLSNGAHSITIYASDLAGNAAPLKTVTFKVAKPEITVPLPLSIAFAVLLAVAIAVIVILLVSRKILRHDLLKNDNHKTAPTKP
jgi:parallel beta-helix repeat protein